MAEQSSGERTEEATPRKKEQAREKGDRLTSRDLATATAGIAGAVWLWAMGSALGGGLHEALAQGLSVGRQDIAAFQPLEQLLGLLAGLGLPLVALGGVVLVAAAIGQAATGGFAFTADLLLPKFDRMNPLNGLGRMFGPHGLAELGKALAKAILLLTVSGWMLFDSLPLIIGLSAMPLEAAVPAAAGIGLDLLLWLSLGLAFIAGIDLPLQLLRWLKRLRMSKQDVKDEYRQQEGSPEVRMALRRAARDALKRSSRGAMADATVVLTNPTHFAVALRYRPDSDSAPLILARGRGLVADVIRELAAEQGTPILSYPSVARALYFTGRVGGLIRPDLYAAVATILAFVLRMEKLSGSPSPPEAEAPPSAQYDENGRRTA
ncbi:MAG: EscU/YscU/HrcU family type III secretion system export apparatus switch protein [Sandaracinobacteroides sp.]